MFKIRVRAGRESRQHRDYQHDEYGHGGYDEENYDQYGDYSGPQDRPGADIPQNECCICGDDIISGHLVFVIRDKNYEIHTSCLVTGVALLTNSITLLVGLFKKKFGSDKQLESEEE